MEQQQEQRLTATLEVIALKIKNKGGNQIAHHTAAIYAKQLLKSGKSAATAIDKGVKAGLRIGNNSTYTLLA